MSNGNDRDRLAERYTRVRSAIPPHVKLIAVSKKRTVEEIQALYDLGHREFGESYPQELRDKHPFLPPDIEWHFIGNLQANKVKYVVPVASLVQTVDSERILDVLNKRAGSIEKKVQVLFQVHIALEETKHGFSANEVEELFNNWDPLRWPNIAPRGLMGMATNTEDPEQVRMEFRTLKTLFSKLCGHSMSAQERFDQLSMGMSGDHSIAVEEGSTMVRIGTAIFGDRGN